MDTSIIAGRNSVTEALKAGRSVTKIYMTAQKEAPPLARIRTLAKERKIRRYSGHGAIGPGRTASRCHCPCRSC